MSLTVSDLLEAASAALGTPPELVRRSAAARAQVNGTTVDDILAAWSGGAPAPAAAAEPQAVEPAQVDEPTPQQVEEPEPAAVAVIQEPAPAPAPVPEPEPEIELEPVPMATRVKTAVRVGAWTGAALGVVGFLAASTFWAPNAIVVPESGPLVQVSPNGVILGIALVSVVFGAIVAGVSRAAAGWANPAMQLSSSRAGTVWVGGGVGLVLGIVAGAMLDGLGTAVEGSDPPLVQLPILSSLMVMILGGAVLGGLTALIPQLVGVPVALDPSDDDEVATVRTRLGRALSIPLAGLVLLVLLVLPFAYALIQSNHLAPNGGAIVAIVAAGGILGFSALAGTKPEIRISLGDLMWAILGLGTVLVIIISVLLYAGGSDQEAEEPAEPEAIVQVL